MIHSSESLPGVIEAIEQYELGFHQLFHDKHSSFDISGLGTVTPVLPVDPDASNCAKFDNFETYQTDSKAIDSTDNNSALNNEPHVSLNDGLGLHGLDNDGTPSTDASYLEETNKLLDLESSFLTSSVDILDGYKLSGPFTERFPDGGSTLSRVNGTSVLENVVSENSESSSSSDIESDDDNDEIDQSTLGGIPVVVHGHDDTEATDDTYPLSNDEKTQKILALKQSLKDKIRIRRESEGVSEIPVEELFESPKVYELTPEEEAKNETRKARNRNSATRSRQKRNERQDQLEREEAEQEEINSQLVKEIRMLEKMKMLFRSKLIQHVTTEHCVLKQPPLASFPPCTCNKGTQGSPAHNMPGQQAVKRTTADSYPDIPNKVQILSAPSHSSDTTSVQFAKDISTSGQIVSANAKTPAVLSVTNWTSDPTLAANQNNSIADVVSHSFNTTGVTKHSRSSTGATALNTTLIDLTALQITNLPVVTNQSISSIGIASQNNPMPTASIQHDTIFDVTNQNNNSLGTVSRNTIMPGMADPLHQSVATANNIVAHATVQNSNTACDVSQNNTVSHDNTLAGVYNQNNISANTTSQNGPSAIPNNNLTTNVSTGAPQNNRMHDLHHCQQMNISMINSPLASVHNNTLVGVPAQQQTVTTHNATPSIATHHTVVPHVTTQCSFLPSSDPKTNVLPCSASHVHARSTIADSNNISTNCKSFNNIQNNGNQGSAMARITKIDNQTRMALDGAAQCSMFSVDTTNSNRVSNTVSPHAIGNISLGTTTHGNTGAMNQGQMQVSNPAPQTTVWNGTSVTLGDISRAVGPQTSPAEQAIQRIKEQLRSPHTEYKPHEIDHSDRNLLEDLDQLFAGLSR